jgi:hypothetical protein
MVRFHIYSSIIDTWILIYINITYLELYERDLVDKLIIIFLFKIHLKCFLRNHFYVRKSDYF